MIESTVEAQVNRLILFFFSQINLLFLNIGCYTASRDVICVFMKFRPCLLPKNFENRGRGQAGTQASGGPVNTGGQPSSQTGRHHDWSI
jgi:hypothetical protein